MEGVNQSKVSQYERGCPAALLRSLKAPKCKRKHYNFEAWCSCLWKPKENRQPDKNSSRLFSFFMYLVLPADVTKGQSSLLGQRNDFEEDEVV